MVAIVTGAGSGIGRGIAVALARRGIEVWLLGRNRAALARVGIGRIYPLDITDSAQGEAFLQHMQAKPPDWVIHAAGLMPIGRFGRIDWEQAVRTNFLGPLELTFRLREAYPNCRPVFLLSDTALSALPGAAIYSCSKAALRAFVLKQPDWNAVEVFPPVTRTAMTDVVAPAWMRWLLASPRRVGEAIVHEMLAGKSSIRQSLVSKSSLCRLVYRAVTRSGVQWIR
jgi:uncharacterized oxidoreductase